MSRFARTIGAPVLSLACVVTLGWPQAVRTTLYRALYPLTALDRASLAAPPSQLVALGYKVDAPEDLARFHDLAAPAAGAETDDVLKIRKLAEVIYRYHPGREPFPRIPGGRERGLEAIFSDIQAGKFALCGQKTMVLAALWRSLGGDVRQIRFSEGDDEVAWYAAHYGIEVYSQEWRKWFYYDATLNGLAEKPSGEPLSLVEIDDRVASGQALNMVSSDEHFDWSAAEFLQSLRVNRLQVYSLDSRLRGQDPDRRFGGLHFGYALLSRLPKPLDRLFDAVTGDAGRRFIAAPRPSAAAAQAHVSLSASPSGQALSPSAPPPGARATPGRHRRSF